MRDLFLLCFLPVAIYFIFRRPFIGVALSAWTSIFAPHTWVWGFGTSLRVNLVITTVTVLSFIINKREGKGAFTSASIWMLVLFVWGTLATMFTEGISTVAWFEWDVFWKIIFLFFMVTMVINTRHRVEVVLWAVAIAGSLIGCNEGLKYIISGAGHIIVGPPGTRIGDRNDLALALNMLLPVCFFLYNSTKHQLLKKIMLGVIIANIVCIIGSFSRGGFIGLCIVAFFYFLKGKNKILILTGSLVVAAALPSLMPQSWFDRMNTIETATEDMSFIGRVQAWKQAVLMANDHPVFGGGFKAGQNTYLWRLYEPEFEKFDHIVQTSHVSFPFAKAAHSIYFQVLGDLGYCGLFIYLMLLLTAYRHLGYAASHAGEDEWLRNVANSLKVSMIVFGVSGALLSQPYFDLTFVVIGLSVVLCTMARQRRSATTNAGAAVAPALQTLSGKS